eukprot:3885848-Pleurochrysis_carterae.AAC.1
MTVEQLHAVGPKIYGKTFSVTNARTILARLRGGRGLTDQRRTDSSFGERSGQPWFACRTHLGDGCGAACVAPAAGEAGGDQGGKDKGEGGRPR